MRSFTRYSAGLLLGFIGLSVLGGTALAYTSPGAPDGYVNDFAQVLSAEQEALLTEKVHQYKVRTSNELAVVTIPTLGDETIETYAVKLFEEWGIGKKETDNGALLLLAIQDRKLRIEVGYGLESVLTDAKSAQIISGATPVLKQQRYPEAIQQMTDAMIATLDLGETEPVSSGSVTLDESTARWVMFGVIAFMVLVALVPIIVIIMVAMKGGFKRGGFSGGGTSSGGWDSSSDSSSSSSSSSDSFSGGSSGGGGSSGSW